MEGLAATPQQTSATPDISKDNEEAEQKKEDEREDTVKTEPAAELSTTGGTAAARRASSTGPTAVSLCVLPQVSPDLSTTQLTAQSQDATGGASRLGRGFPLKLDLSSTALRQTFPIDLGVDGVGVERPPSPVTLAPRTAKPRADDPVSALIFPGPTPFNSSLPPYSSQPGSAFSSASAMPLASVVANAMSGAGGSLPGILSAFSGAGGARGADIPNDGGTNPQPMMGFGGSDPLSGQQDVIDLTQPTPVLGTGMSLPMNGGHPDDTIDLTMDSPTIPLSQLVGTKKNDAGGTNFGDGGFGLESGGGGGGKDGDVLQQTGGSGHDALDGLLSSFVNPSSQDLSRQPFAPSDPTARSLNSIMPSDATSMLASLTGASGQDNQFSGLGMSDPGGLNGLDDLNIGGMAFSNLDGMGGMSFGGGGGAGAGDDVSFATGMDIDGMSSLYMPGDFGDGGALKDGAASDPSDPLRDLMVDDGSGMDLSAFLSDIGGGGEPDIGGRGLTGQNENK